MELFKSKLPHVGTTIFTEMSALANQHGAINLSQGFPDFDVSDELKKRLTYYVENGYNQYSPMQGELPLRQVIAKKTHLVHGHSYNPETEITITAGATQAIFTAIVTCVSRGEEVIVFGPAYDCYEPAVTLCGGITRFLNLKSPDFTIDLEELEKTINANTKLVIINSPHNPTGALIDRDTMLALQQMLEGTDIMLISDEVYEHITFDGVEHESVTRFEGLRKRTFLISSFGKTIHATGWKIGYCAAPELLTKEFRKVHQFNVFSCHRPTQLAIADYLQEPSHYQDVSPFYQQKRDLFCREVAGSRFKLVPTRSTYFQLLDYSEIEKIRDVDMAKKLTIEYGVAAIPVSVFYEEPPAQYLLRFCFAKNDQTIKDACKILREI